MEIAYSSFSGEFDGLQGVVASDTPGLIIDAGGYIGTAALALSDLFPNADILTIEPSDENISVLRRNISMNNRISAIHGALVPDDHAGPINLVDRGGGQWGFTLGDDDEEGQVACTAEPISIANILKDLGVKQVLIFKMDIEGSERELLLKSQDWLPRTKALFVELHPKIHSDVIDAYNDACIGRQNFDPVEEKYLSISEAIR
jgi:FkbM family methyltransferase